MFFVEVWFYEHRSVVLGLCRFGIWLRLSKKPNERIFLLQTCVKQTLLVRRSMAHGAANLVSRGSCAIFAQPKTDALSYQRRSADIPKNEWPAYYTLKLQQRLVRWL